MLETFAAGSTTRSFQPSYNLYILPCFVKRQFVLLENTAVGRIPLRYAPNHSGIFPCFLGGMVSRLVSSMRRAAINLGRVSCGSMMASTQPRSAAM